MTFLVKGTKKRHSVVFKKRGMSESGLSSTPSHTAQPLVRNNKLEAGQLRDITEEGSYINSSPDEQGSSNDRGFYVHRPSVNQKAMSTQTLPGGTIPDLFTNPPVLRDLFTTGTSSLQDETIQECLPFLSGTQSNVRYNNHGVPHLDRNRHIQFLHKSLRKLPAPYVAADASRPWMFYWALAGLSTMGEDVSEYREKLISTVRPIQNATGGFGGGNGQMSHLAPTYAIILSLAMVGGKEALDLIDRKAMWKWLGALKQPDGGYQMSVGGEVDVR